jgi:hypothetical protein
LTPQEETRSRIVEALREFLAEQGDAATADRAWARPAWIELNEDIGAAWYPLETALARLLRVETTGGHDVLPMTRETWDRIERFVAKLRADTRPPSEVRWDAQTVIDKALSALARKVVREGLGFVLRYLETHPRADPPADGLDTPAAVLEWGLYASELHTIADEVSKAHGDESATASLWTPESLVNTLLQDDLLLDLVVENSKARQRRLLADARAEVKARGRP